MNKIHRTSVIVVAFDKMLQKLNVEEISLE